MEARNSQGVKPAFPSPLDGRVPTQWARREGEPAGGWQPLAAEVYSRSTDRLPFNLSLYRPHT